MATEFDEDLSDDAESDEIHYVGLYAAQVVNVEDPLELGRVKFTIPGMVEPEGAWAFPVGTISGGSKNRGFYDVPDKGADIVVQFIQGDIEQPVYWGGWWGNTDAGRETPGPTETAGKSVRPKIKAYETERFLLLFDENENKLVIRDKGSGYEIALLSSGVHLASEGATEQVIKGNAFMTALNTYVDAVNTFAGTCITAPPATPAAALSAATAAFKTIAQQALSAVVRTS